MILTPKLVTVSNFARWRQQTFVFKPGVTYVVGPNGVGKTSLIVDSWAWALGRQTSKGARVDDVITHGETTTRSAFAFAGAGHTYEVTRFRGDANQGDRLLFTDNGVPMGGRLTPSVQATIDAVLGSDVRTLLHQTVFAQRARRFTLLTEGEQRKLLEHYLGLSILPSAYGLARKDLQAAELERARMEQQKQSSKVILLSAVRDLKQERTDLEHRLAVLKAEVAHTRTDLKDAQAVKATEDDWIRKLNDAALVLRTEVADLHRRIKLTKNGQCETCHQPVSATSVAALQIEMARKRRHARKLDKARAKKEALPIHQRVAEFEVQVVQTEAKVQAAEAQLKRHQRYATKTDTVEAAKMSFQEANRQLASLETKAQRIEFWLEGFSGKGIRRDVMRWALPVLSQEATAVSKQLGIEEVSVDEDPAGALRVRARSLHGSVLAPFTVLSGGEKTRVDFALAEGLRGLARVGLPTLMELEVYDDPFEGLDEEGERLVIQYLQRKPQVPVYILSPDDRLSDEFQNVVSVERRGQWSRVSV
jgi:DNA repair exonuclease SbcCD ATPase subunit